MSFIAKYHNYLSDRPKFYLANLILLAPIFLIFVFGWFFTQGVWNGVMNGWLETKQCAIDLLKNITTQRLKIKKH